MYHVVQQLTSITGVRVISCMHDRSEIRTMVRLKIWIACSTLAEFRRSHNSGSGGKLSEYINAEKLVPRRITLGWSHDDQKIRRHTATGTRL